MVRTLGYIAAGLAVLLVAVLAYAATRPDSFRVERMTSIKAPPEKIFVFVNDLHRWQSWSPYEKKDPGMKRLHSGAPAGKGAVYEWDGNGQIGKGRMEIRETTAPSKVTIDLTFVEPFETRNLVEFTLKPNGGSTDVTWSMDGPSPYVAKLMGIFVDMDSMIGKDFEIGLASLKTLAEAAP